MLFSKNNDKSIHWASADEIRNYGILDFNENEDISGVVLGTNQYTGKAMVHIRPENVFILAPARSGKDVNSMIPSAMVWKESLFCLDIGSHKYHFSSAFRRKKLGQKVIWFSPLSSVGSARWNPLAELRFLTPHEYSDVSMLSESLFHKNYKTYHSDPFWDQSSVLVLNGVILHLFYVNKRLGKPFPSFADVVDFVFSSFELLKDDMDLLFKNPHISPEEFLSDNNILYELYGEYIKNWHSINSYLASKDIAPVHNIAEAKQALQLLREKTGKDIPWENPAFGILLIHPLVYNAFSFLFNTASNTALSILSTLKSHLVLFKNPLIQRNTAESDFCIQDLKNPLQPVSVYFCYDTMDSAILAPLARLFVDMMLYKLVRSPDVPDSKTKKLRKLLLLLDQFTSIGYCVNLEVALACCSYHSVQACLTAQNVRQIEKIYGRNNLIASNCHVQIYLLPSFGAGGSAADFMSECVGDNKIDVSAALASLPDSDEIIFVAGHRLIHGKKFRYYENSWFINQIREGDSN